MPGSFFTPATPVILPQAEDKPESSKATSSEPSLDLEIVELIKSTRESLLDDQCLLRNLFLDLQGQQRDMQGFLSSLFRERISLKQSVRYFTPKLRHWNQQLTIVPMIDAGLVLLTWKEK